MIGLDTNVIIRYLTQDDKKQAAKANKLIDHELSSTDLGFITLTGLIEVVWVLESCYDQPKEKICGVLNSTRQLLIEHADLAYLALKRYVTGKAGFSDALIAVASEQKGCDLTATFDKKAVSVGMVLLSCPELSAARSNVSQFRYSLYDDVIQAILSLTNSVIGERLCE